MSNHVRGRHACIQTAIPVRECVAVCTMHECRRVASSERHFCDLFCYYILGVFLLNRMSEYLEKEEI